MVVVVRDGQASEDAVLERMLEFHSDITAHTLALGVVNIVYLDSAGTVIR